METLRVMPSSDQENQQHQEDLNRLDLWSFDFSFSASNSPEKDTRKINEALDILYDHNNESNDVNKSTSVLDFKSKNNVHKQKDSLLENQEFLTDNLMESIDLSDLSFLSNDFILEDCTCFEQASQLVDPSLKDSESTPFSFNNSDIVQLFRYSPNENIDSLLGLTEDYLFNNNTEKCDKTICHGDDSIRNDCYNFYRVFELFDSNMNVNKGKKSQSSKDNMAEYSKTSKKKKDYKNKLISPIKKGRRYLPNFKHKVLEYTKTHTFKETALHFKINCNTITEWSRESKRLSLQHKCTTSMPGSDLNNYKTDTNGTHESKTDIIFLNDDISLETDFNEPILKNIEKELPIIDMKPDERFLKWIETKRLEKKQLSRNEVYYIAMCCLKKSTANHDKPSWFVMWFKRFTKVLKKSRTTDMEVERYIKYPNNFKLEVALYARIFTKNSAARVFNVPRRRMFEWFNNLNPLKDSFTLSTTKEVNGNLEKDNLILEATKDKTKRKLYAELHLWYQKKFVNGARPTCYEIKEKAKEIFSLCGITSIKFSDGWLQKFCQRMNIKLRHCDDDSLLLWVLTQIDNNVALTHQDITDKSASLVGGKKFKGSKGWTLRFLKRHGNLLQNTPSVKDQLPQIVQEKLNCFWDNFRQCLNSRGITPGNVGCMDEIPIRFTYPEEGKSSSLPLLRKSGFGNCQAIVILSALASGHLLPPFVIFKGKGIKQLFSERNVNILIFYEEKGLISCDVVESWVNDVWLSCTPNPSALIVDSFEPHSAISLKQFLAKKNSYLHVIPEGCSSRFQPLDVEITSLFKEEMKKKWREFSMSSQLSSKRNNSYRCPDQDTILHWVRDAYEKIKQNPLSIINSFKATGLL